MHIFLNVNISEISGKHFKALGRDILFSFFWESMMLVRQTIYKEE